MTVRTVASVRKSAVTTSASAAPVTLGHCVNWRSTSATLTLASMVELVQTESIVLPAPAIQVSPELPATVRVLLISLSLSLSHQIDLLLPHSLNFP